MKPKSRRRFFSGKSRSPMAAVISRLPRVQEQTGAETLYLTQLIQNKTRVSVKLLNDEEIFGWIEYYDRDFIRVTRDGLPNVFVYKDQIKLILETGRK